MVPPNFAQACARALMMCPLTGDFRTVLLEPPSGFSRIWLFLRSAGLGFWPKLRSRGFLPPPLPPDSHRLWFALGLCGATWLETGIWSGFWLRFVALALLWVGGLYFPRDPSYDNTVYSSKRLTPYNPATQSCMVPCAISQFSSVPFMIGFESQHNPSPQNSLA